MRRTANNEVVKVQTHNSHNVDETPRLNVFSYRFEKKPDREQFERRLESIAASGHWQSLLIQVIYVNFHSFFTNAKTNGINVIYTRAALSACLVLSSHIHWTRISKNRQKKIVPFKRNGCDRFGDSRTVLLGFDFSIFWLSVHGVDFMAGQPWTFAMHFKSLTEFLLLIALEPCFDIQLAMGLAFVWPGCCSAMWFFVIPGVHGNMGVDLLCFLGLVLFGLFLAYAISSTHTLSMSLRFIEWREMRKIGRSTIVRRGTHCYGSVVKRRLQRTDSVGGQIDHTLPVQKLQRALRTIRRDAKLSPNHEALLRKAMTIIESKGVGMFQADVIDQIDSNSTILNKHASAVVLEHVRPRESMKFCDTKFIRHGTVQDQLQPGSPILDKSALHMEKSFNSFNFDIFQYTNDATAAFVDGGLYAMKAHHIFDIFDVNVQVTARALKALSELYLSTNPYHNRLHGLDVCQMSHLLLIIIDNNHPEMLTPLSSFAILLGSLAHDVGHLGVNNAFLIELQHPLALRYNDEHVLEMMHVAEAYRVFSDPATCMLAGLSQNDYRNLRSLMIECILGTDLADHFKILGNASSTLKLADCDTMRILNSADGGVSMIPDRAFGSHSKESAENAQTIICQLLIKTSDLGHPARDGNVHEKWSLRMCEEFWRQGDQLAAQKLEVPAMMDRTKTEGFPKSQMGFISVLVAPLHILVASFLGPKNMGPFLLHLHRNFETWKEKSASTSIIEVRVDSLENSSE